MATELVFEMMEREMERALLLAKERVIKKYEERMMADFREEMAKIVLRTEEFYSIQRQENNVIITLHNKVEKKG